jgi:hypothetical protein
MPRVYLLAYEAATHGKERLTVPVTVCRPNETFRVLSKLQPGGNTVQWVG